MGKGNVQLIARFLLCFNRFQKQIIMYQLYYYICILAVLSFSNVFATAQPSSWTINPEDFQYSASINAIIQIDGQASISIGDRAALFVNDELRGVSEPVPVGGSLFHFISVYSNQPVGEEMEIRVYHALDDEVYTAFTTYTFQLQDIAGNFDAPFKIAVRTDGDFPISILNIPTQRTLQGFPFASIDLAEYLNQTDTDPVEWDVTQNQILNASINGSILQVSVNDPSWFGTTNLVISALELGINGYFAFRQITFEVEQAYLGPLWGTFIGESVLPGQSFTNVLLNDFEIQHEGDCLQYSLQPLFEIPDTPLSRPNWQADIFSTPNSMPIVAQVQFTPDFFFNNPNDLLGAFINDEVRGSAEPLFINGQVYYFLQVQNEMPEAQINLRFYSATYQQVFELPYTIPYTGINGLGTIEIPLELDFSPFVFDISNTSVTQINVQDETWQGYQSYLFTVEDCDYPGLLLDQTEVTYCIGEDNDLDGFCDLNDPDPEDRCIPDHYPPTLKVLNEQANVINSQQSVNHNADQGDCLKSLTWAIIVNELCEIPQVEVQIIAENAEVTPSANTVLVSTNTDEATFNLVIQASVGSNQLFITATDSDGNTSEFEYQIDVSDTQAPMPVCQFAQVWLNPEGQAELLPEQVLNTASSSDNCNIEHLSVSKTDYDCSNLGNNTVTLTAIDKAGNTSNCNASISVAQSGELPQNWQSTDIGQVTVGNTYFFDPCTASTVQNGEYTLVGSGNNATSSTNDNIAFASQTLCGDGTITAKIESISPNGYGGLMVRESNAPGAKQAAVFSNQTNILRHETRYTSNAPKQINSFFKPAPFWLRMERSGPWIFSYYSTNGISFQYVHGVFVPMQECVEIGLSSFTFQPFSQTEAVFSHVSIQEGNGLNGIETAELVSTKDFEARSGVSIFPNPVNDVINLILTPDDNKEATAILRNQMGQIIEQRQLGRNAITTEWNVSHLQPGIYLIEIRKQGGPLESLRFVKTD